MKRLSFHKSILAWFTLAFLILMLVSYSSYKSFTRLNNDKNWVDHTYTVIDNLNAVLSNLLDLQSAQRGYILTGQDDYLARYTLALPEIKIRFSNLETLLSEDSLQIEKLKRVETETAKRLESLQEVISVYDTKGADPAFDLVKSGSGKKEMSEIRVLIAQMINDETHLLEMRKYNADQTMFTTLKIGGMGVAICILILSLVFTTIYRESLKRQKIEASLQSALEDMEHSTYQTSLLSKLSDYMQSCQTVEEAFKVIGSSMTQLLAETSGSVATFRNSRNLVETMSSWGPQTDVTPKDFNPDQCWGLRRGRAHYFVPGGTEPCCEHFGTEPRGASLCLPMQAQGEIIGLFSVVIESLAQTSKDKVAFCRRVSEQISLAIANLNLQNKLREQSIRDPLTRLFNRRYLETTRERELKRAERNKDPLSILVLDIDHFKKFNDTMGHDAGDALLSQFAELLEKSVRKEDIVCRYGGEEFVIVLPMASLEMAVMRANKICEATRELKIRSTNNSMNSVSVSIGVSAFPLHSTGGADLITIADAALYQSKHNGRDQVTAASFVSKLDQSA